MAQLAELFSLDATALADLVRSRSVSPLELVEADVSPIRGVILGGGDHSLRVKVDVNRLEEG